MIPGCAALRTKRTLGGSCKAGRPALGLTIILNFSLSALLGGNWIPVLLEKRPMHTSPSQIARSLRAFAECAQARLVARRSHSARTEPVRSRSRTVR